MKKSFGFRSILLAILMVAGSTSWAQAFPDRLIRIILPFNPGGPSDNLARMLSDGMTEVLKQPIIIENKPGATGIIGSQYVKNAKPDGYTLLFTGNSALVSGALVKKAPPFDASKDFAAVGRVVHYPLYVVVNAAIPANNMQEFVAYAKSKPEGIFHSSIGVGSVGHLACEAIAQRAGFNLTYVPYNGIAASRTAVIRGDAQLTCDSAVAQPFVENGQLRGMAVTSDERLKLLPNVPTIGEVGLKGAEATVWLGMFAPAGTPPDILNKLSAAMHHAMRKPNFIQQTNLHAMEVVFETPAQAATAVKADRDMWSRVIKERNVALID